MNPNEARIQAECFTYHWNNYPDQRMRMFHINNNPKNKIDGARLKAMGLVSGVADMCYLRANKPPLFMEFKKPGETQEPEQVQFEEMCNGIGVGYVIIRSLEDFKKHLEV